MIAFAEIVQLDEMQHVGLHRRVEGVSWESEMGDGVAVDSCLAVRWVGDGIGDEAHVDGGILEIRG